MTTTTSTANDNSATIASFHLTGKGPFWNQSNDMLRATARQCALKFYESEGRMLDDHEMLLLWAAVQRWHGVPEQSLMPEEMRRQ